MSKESLNKKVLRGIVVSADMDKTAVISVSRVKTHRLYDKKFHLHKNYKIDDAKNICKVNDMVEFVETRPISKEKKHKLYKIVK